MSQSDDDADPLEAAFWGDIADFMPAEALDKLGAVGTQANLTNVLRDEVNATPSVSAASGGSSGRMGAGRGAQDYEDDPTLSEDLEDEEFPILRPAPAPVLAARPVQLAGAYAAGEDDYDDDEDDSAPAAAAAPAAARPEPAQQYQAQLQYQQQPSALQLPVGYTPAGVPSPSSLQQQQQQYAALQQLQQLQAAGVPLNSLQAQQLQQFQQMQQSQQQPLPAFPAPAAADQPQPPQQQYIQPQQQQQPPVVRGPQLTPEQQRLRALNQATEFQERKQEDLAFRYLDLDQVGEDIVHFSELYMPTDNQVTRAYLTSFARVPPSTQQAVDQGPWERARQRADALLNRHYQQKALQEPGADADVAEDDTEKFHRGDVAAAAAEGNVVQLGLQNVKLEVVEELSEPEEDLFASDPEGLGRAMMQATRLNAVRSAATAAAAAAKAAQVKAAVTAGDTDPSAAAAAGEDDGAGGLDSLADGMQGLGLKGTMVNPHALDALHADILPNWEQEVEWVNAAAAGPLAGLLIGTDTAHFSTQALQQLQALSLALQQQQHQQGSLMGPLPRLPGLPGMSSSGPLPGRPPLPGQPPLGLSGSQPSFLSGSFSTAKPHGSMGLPGVPLSSGMSGGPHGASGLPGLQSGPMLLPGQGSALQQDPMSKSLGLQDPLGKPLGLQDPLSKPLGAQHSVQDAAAAAATMVPEAAAAAAAAGSGGGAGASGHGKGGRGGKHQHRGPTASVTLGKPRKPLEAALAVLKLHDRQLRLVPSIAAAVAAAAASDGVDVAAATAAASGDRAAAAALAVPQRWPGAHAGAAGAGLLSASQAAAEAEDPLKLKHVGELLQQELKPVLPDDEEWLNDIVWEPREAGAGAGSDVRSYQQQRQLADSLSSLGLGQQQAMVVRQQLGMGGGGRVPVLWDLNDPHMVFEAHSTQPFVNASAVMHPAPAQDAAALPPHLQNEKDPLLRQLAPLHISRDYQYQASERASGRTTTTGRHSTLALNMTTVPVFPKDAMLPLWHRPNHWWSAAHMLYNLEDGRRTFWLRDLMMDPMYQNPMESVKVTVIGLNLREGARCEAEPSTAFNVVYETSLRNRQVWKDLIAQEQPRLRIMGRDFQFDDNNGIGWMGTWVDPSDKHRPLSELGFKRGHNWIIPVWSCVSPLKTRQVAVLLPPTEPCRPPAAFKTVKSLSASSPGHVLLLEYLEQRPLMMLQTGMGMRLTTYYRRKSDNDMHYQALQAEYSEGLLARQALPLTSQDLMEARPPWMVGTPQLLTPDDTSPFYELAPIPPGEMQFAVDTPTFRAPAVPHVAASTDFLLARLAGGNIALREITGCVTVGQQHPVQQVWTPGSEQAVAYERARIKAYILRSLKNQAERSKAVKAGKAVPCVSLQELQRVCSGMAIVNNPAELPSLLAECQCVETPLPDKKGSWWTWQPGAKMPTDPELKKLVHPDQAVLYEALLAGLGQQRQYHLDEGRADQIYAKLNEIPAGPATTLRLVLDMLFPDQLGKQAASAIEQCVLSTPWAQSAAYQAALVHEGRNPTGLSLVGRGDPTGRGKGFAFIRDDPKKAKEEAAPPPGVKAQADGTITGTGADLRRLSHKRAGEILETKFGVDPAVVKDIPRWDRIDAIRRSVRDPANAGLVNSDPELQQYVRSVKLSAEDVRSKMRSVAKPIFERQMDALHESWEGDTLSDDLSWGAPPQLKAYAQTDEEAESALARQQRAQEELLSAQQQGDAALAQQAQAAMQHAEQDFQRAAEHPGLNKGRMTALIALKPAIIRGATAAQTGGKGGHKAVPGERRIRREITYITANTSRVHRTMYIYGREEMNALNALYKSGEGFGERRVVPISAGKKHKLQRTPLGVGFSPFYPAQLPEMSDPPLPEGYVMPTPLQQHTAGAAASQAAAAYWPAADDPMAAGYVQDAGAWQQPVAPPVPRAPKALSKKQQQKIKEEQRRQAKKQQQKPKKRRRGVEDFSDDESISVSDSGDDLVLQMAAEGEDSEDEGSPRAKRARPARAAAASAGGAAAAGAGDFGAPAAAAAGGYGPVAVAPYVPPPDLGVGAGDGASPRMLRCLQELSCHLRKYIYQPMNASQNKRSLKGFTNLFLSAVPPALIPDYSDVVPPAQQMWLARIDERLKRCFYNNRQQLLSDANMILAAARTYHQPPQGALRLTLPNPQIVRLAEAMLAEAHKAMQSEIALSQLDYWEARVALEAIRDQGPEAFKQAHESALQYSQQDPEGFALPQGWHWVMCDECQKWRVLSGTAYLEPGLDKEGASFKCADNLDFPGSTCADKDHWQQPEGAKQ